MGVFIGLKEFDIERDDNEMGLVFCGGGKRVLFLDG